ncbi:hypothetical protein R3P38DRAFT_2803455 [Favolaschia claudopus]|uniref:Uncharacterized protein n=3 Tax=Favolaschia claudopus TaxID=2862362 RepID=A0AAV9ZS24_9AGAR
MALSLAQRYMDAAAGVHSRPFSLPQIALDEYGVDFVISRDRTIRTPIDTDSVVQTLDRFTYKSRALDSFFRHMVSPVYRSQIPMYEGTLIGEVVDHRHVYLKNPLNMEGKGGECVQFLVKCPTNADAATVKYFKMQTKNLQDIVAADLNELSGAVCQNWTVDDKEGELLIEILVSASLFVAITVVDNEKAAIPCRELRNHIAFGDGQIFQATVNLCKDEQILADSQPNKFFSLWFLEWHALADADVGR